MVLIAEAGKSARVDLAYDSVGRLGSLSRTSNGDPTTTINTNFTLDLLDRVTSITHQKVAGEDASTLSAFTYGYDANGRVVASTGPEGSLSFALDANGQLVSVTGAHTENYQYDPVGNRSATSTTSTGNLLLSDSQFSYTYDLEGNRKTRTRLSDGQLTEYFWDHRNQLTKALIKDASGTLLKELRFTYDVEGRLSSLTRTECSCSSKDGIEYLPLVVPTLGEDPLTPRTGKRLRILTPHPRQHPKMTSASCYHH
jgi:YD repeat-containing protein